MNDESQMKTNRTLVFSIALNGYQLLYSDYIKSHKRYASNHGYHYEVISKPYYTSLGKECAWLKISLLLRALNTGFDAVMFVDADAYIKSTAPPIDTLFEKNKSIYMAKGYSGRFNSGVIILQNATQSKNWLRQLLANCNKAAKNDDIGWGENGQVIAHSINNQFVKTIDSKWNNNYKPELDDYIRHFSAGPLRNSSFIISIYFSAIKLLQKTPNSIKTLFNLKKPSPTSLNELDNVVVKHYPIFN